MKALITISVYLFSVALQAQTEELQMIPFRTEQSQRLHPSTSRSLTVPIHYLLNTIDLPFRDDFSTYRIKAYPIDINHPSVFDSLSYRYTLNGKKDSIITYRRDTVYNFTYNPFTGSFDSTVARPQILRFFLDSFRRFLLTDTLLVYPAYQLVTQNGVTRKRLLTPDSILYNQSQDNYFARDDKFSYWSSNGPFYNRTMAIDPPSLGYLTFDGLDSNGLPYDNSSSFPYGPADYLTSKPINLTGVAGAPLSVGDSVYLSFFYQSGGHGDRPEDRDSLVLQFYAPEDDRWSTVWSLPGAAVGPFQEVKIYVDQLKFLKKGFRFRFFNYATLSGNFDHWHLDYIYLDKNRSRIEDIKDWAIVEPINSYIKPYTNMPYTHFKENPTAFIRDTIKLRMRNLSVTTDISRARYKVYNSGSLNYFYQSTENLFSSVPSQAFYTIPLTVSAPPNNFNFPTDTSYRRLFKIIHHAFSTQDVNRFNDTLRHDQIFDTYYAYDDGTAEKTYNANRPGTDIQIEYNTPVADTLRAVLINFINTFETPGFHQVNIRVFKSLSGAPIWESGPIDVIYQPAGKFTRYNIEGGLPIEGTFFVGWQQLGQDKTYVGFDVNTNNKQHNYYSYLGNWYNSDFEGTLLVRPDFGTGELEPLLVEKPKTHNKPLVYPNPASQTINISLPDNHLARAELLDMGGRCVLSSAVNERQPMDISKVPPGMYLLRITDSQHSVFNFKVVVAR